MIPNSMGQPINLGSSGQMQGVRYITRAAGTTNK
jgi:hypothetical protein